MDTRYNKNIRPGRDGGSRRDSAIAAAVTMIVALALLLLLYFGQVGYSRAQIASASTPEPEEEELYIDPELLNLGEEEATRQDAAAAAPRGVPQQTDKPSEQTTVRGVSEKPAPPKEKRTTQSKPSPVKESEPKASDKERKMADRRTSKAFSPDNGATDGREGASGSGGTSTGIAGNVAGRVFKSCPKPDVTLRNRTVVKVRVTVDADGHVTAATAISGGNASLRRKCERAALQARWSEKKGARPVSGTLTFTLIPR